MHRRFEQHSRAGFTVAELLIVVAIVVVLAAIAIPVFTSSLANAEEATCEANRRSLKSMLATSYLTSLGTVKPDQALLEKDMDSLGSTNANNGLCPQKGRYQLEGDVDKGLIMVKCAVHGATLDDTIYGWIQDTYKNSWDDFWGTDHVVWDEFLKKMGWTEWPEVKGTDGTSYYLKFKGYTNNPENAFLYAGLKSDPAKDDWQSRYVCDSAGKFGEPGQWYELPSVVWLTNIKTDDDFKNLLATGKPVDFVGGVFKPQA